MTDRELLELAAKAAGIDTTRCLQYEDGAFDWPGKAGRWNPLADDGDALRLAVRLQMCIGIVSSNIKDVYATVAFAPANLVEIGETHNADPLAATRRAIVRAASEIGKNL